MTMFLTLFLYCLVKTFLAIETLRQQERVLDEAFKDEPEFLDFLKNSTWTFFVFFFCQLSYWIFYVLGFSYVLENLGAFLIR